MKNIILIFAAATLLVGCNKSYYHYHILNQTPTQVTFHLEYSIDSKDGHFENDISVGIPPGERIMVFEHKPLSGNEKEWPLPQIESSPHIKKAFIVDSKGDASNVDFFCDGCSNYETLDGLFAKYGSYTYLVRK